MTDNIIGFRPKRIDYVMECSHCGWDQFWILESGHIQCTDCKLKTKITQLNELLIEKEDLPTT